MSRRTRTLLEIVEPRNKDNRCTLPALIPISPWTRLRCQASSLQSCCGKLSAVYCQRVNRAHGLLVVTLREGTFDLTHPLPTHDPLPVLSRYEICPLFCSNLRRSFILVVIGRFSNCKGFADILLVCAQFLACSYHSIFHFSSKPQVTSSANDLWIIHHFPIPSHPLLSSNTCWNHHGFFES
jgi:hypothetical protein